MASGLTTIANLDNLRPTFIAEAQLLQEHKGVMTRLVATQKLPKGSGLSLNMPYLKPIVASDLTDGIEIASAQQITDENVSFTTSEKGLMVAWSKRTNYFISENFVRIAADLMAAAMEYKRDRDLLGQLDSFGGIAGAAGTAFTMGLGAAAVTAVREGRAAQVTSGTSTGRTGARTTGDPPTGQPISIVLHERNRYDLAVQLGGLAAVAQGSAVAAATGMTSVGTGGTSDYEARWRHDHVVEGITINGAGFYIDNNLTIDGSDDVKGGVFSREAIQHITLQGIQDKVAESIDGRVSYHTMWIEYGYGFYNDAWGRELYVDATAPTG